MSEYTKDSEWLALLAAVRATTEDDLPRLVAADWLDEHAQPERAAFIRTQIAIARGEVTGRRSAKKRCEREMVSSEAARGWFNCGDANWQLVTGTDTECGRRMTVRRWFVVRRGFVAEAHCPLADWIGFECLACGASGREYGYAAPCSSCRGACRTDGTGPAVLAMHPIQRVAVTDREPWLVSIPGMPNKWLWREEPHAGQELALIPSELYLLLPNPGLGTRDASGRGWMWFESPEAALNALSIALITWALAPPATMT